MKIKEIEIENYRGFRGKKHLVCKDNLNVFVGVNGSGKSSLLDLIATFLNLFVIQFSRQFPSKKAYQFTDFDINIEEKESNNKFIAIKKDKLFSLKIKRFSYITVNSNISEFNIPTLTKLDTKINIPVFKYFQAQRNVNENVYEAPKKRYIVEQFKAYDDAFSKNYNFDKFIWWFVEEENKENRTKIKQRNFSYNNPNLEAIRNAIRLFLENMPAFEYRNLRVEDRPFNLKTNEKSSLVIDKNGKTFNLKQLSDGEQLLILMVSDIAHRLSIANPSLENCLEGEGVVLIDEISLHLHPSWQRYVIPCFLKTFPNIQFFATTHSPQVLSNVKHENIFIIEDFEILPFTPNTYGRDSNSILWDIFGVAERPKHTKDKLNEFYKLLDEEEAQEKVKKLLAELSAQLGENDPEILRAKLHFEFLNDID
ncbi:MAG: AAA family ATPase [Chitinophagales bacterium]